MKFRLVVLSLLIGSLSLGCGDNVVNVEGGGSVATSTPGTPPTATDTSTPGSPTDTPEPTATPTETGTEGPTGTPTDTRTPGETVICGNRLIEGNEECDIGGICVGGTNELAICDKLEDCEGGGVCKTVGGQPSPDCPVEGREGPNTCAANCTCESERFAEFAEGTRAHVQTGAFLIKLPLTGSHEWRTGQPREDNTIGLDGQVIVHAGDLPVVQKADALIIDKVKLTGLVCACVRGVEVPFFGAGNSATGVISCGETPLVDVNVVLAEDHHTAPLPWSGHDQECSLAPDPECDTSFTFPSGVSSNACSEPNGPRCDDPAVSKHTDVCNSPREAEFFGGPAGQGDARISLNTSIGLLIDAGVCTDAFEDNPENCPPFLIKGGYGPDCVPCTDDDTDKGDPENNPLVTGVTSSIVYNANDFPNSTIVQSAGDACASDADCGGCGWDNDGGKEICIGGVCEARCAGNACRTVATGMPFDCQLLADNPGGGLSGSSLAVSFPSVDARTIGDNVTSVEFRSK